MLRQPKIKESNNEVDFDGFEFEDPMSYKQAISSENTEKWLKAMQNELESQKTRGVWKLVEFYMDVALKWENVRNLLSLHPFKAPKYVNNKRGKVFTRLASYLRVKKRSNQIRDIYILFCHGFQK